MSDLLYVIKKAKTNNILNIISQIGLDETADILEKGRPAQIGEIRDWHGIKYQKQPNGEWKLVKKNKMGKVAEESDFNEHKEGQLEIIKRTNPAPDEYHTWIRNVEDIKAFDELLEDEDEFSYPDFTIEDARLAKEKGKVTVYSSYPIEEGKFVSPSKRNAQDYAGTSGKIYSKEVSFEDIAWINGDEGQYTPVQISSPKEISATVAPYFNTTYREYQQMSPKQKNKMHNSFKKMAINVAKVLDINLDINDISFNVGGYQFEDGDSVVEPSFTFPLFASPEEGRLFACLMGDLGFEQQEAVVSSYDIESYDDADGIRWSIKFSDTEMLLELLHEHDIKNFTYDKTNGTLSVLSFDEDDVSKLKKLVNNLNNNSNGEQFEITETSFKSSYDGKGARRVLYESWLESNKGETTELYNFVQEACSRVNAKLKKQNFKNKENE